MNEKVLRLFTGDDFAELSKRPDCRRMRGDIEVSDPASSYLHDHKYVQQSKVGSDGHEEVASENGLGVVRTKVIQC